MEGGERDKRVLLETVGETEYWGDREIFEGDGGDLICDIDLISTCIQYRVFRDDANKDWANSRNALDTRASLTYLRSRRRVEG